MKLPLLLIPLLLAGNVFADAGLPKKAVLVTSLAASTQEVTVSDIQLKLLQGKCTTNSLGSQLREVQFGQNITITVGAHTYQVVDTKSGGDVSFRLPSPNCALDLANISMIHLTLAHPEVKDMVVNAILSLEDDMIALSAGFVRVHYGPSTFVNEHAKVTEKY